MHSPVAPRLTSERWYWRSLMVYAGAHWGRHPKREAVGELVVLEDLTCEATRFAFFDAQQCVQEGVLQVGDGSVVQWTPQFCAVAVGRKQKGSTPRGPRQRHLRDG